MGQADAFRMISRRALAAGIQTHISCHSFRATGITDYRSQRRHAGNRAADDQPRERAHDLALRQAGDEVNLDEVERIVI